MFYYLWKKKLSRHFYNSLKKILNLRKKTALLSEEQLKNKFNFFRQWVIDKSKKKPKTVSKLLNQILIPVFAIVREVIYRKTELLLYPTQILGGIILHYGNVAQMNTGEGKTHAGFLPVCLNVLSNRTVFVVTVNEYLSHRDQELAKPILDFFQITSGVNSTILSPEDKQDLYYNCSVIYTTSSSLVFDYLQNNLVLSSQEKIKTDYYYAIVDESDSLLMDEARNAMIISSHSLTKDNEEELSDEDYKAATELANIFRLKLDYRIDYKEKDLWLTDIGRKKIEKFFRINNLFSFTNHRYNFLLHNALKAKHFYFSNVHYVVDYKQKKIVLIDALTGRLVPNQVYPFGIQQAVESKEGTTISAKSKTIATITYQIFFRLFEKLSGMTGTAESEAEEFRRVYGMEVMIVPPYRKLIRKDYSDLFFWDKNSKYQAIIKVVEKIRNTTKQPILICSPDVQTSEHLSNLLAEKKIFHYKLNAVYHKQEAEIISQGGKLGSIIISTNMAGRGTDIRLSEESRKVGGLFVIGVENDFTLRSRLQLKGRAGRQGDPGKSRFYVSLDDELIKSYFPKEKIKGIFGDKNLKNLLSDKVGNKILSFLISEPQEMIKNSQAYQRQRALDYDLLIARQRQTIYDFRDKLLFTSNFLRVVGKEKKQSKKQKKIMNITANLDHLRFELIKTVDDFWADYLEILEKTRSLVKIKVYLSKNPQEAFFWETTNMFNKGFRKLNKQLQSTINSYLII